MTYTLTDSRRWMRDGTKILLDAVGGLDHADYDAPSSLPGWKRRHVIAHVAANADALGNLVHWARTGDATPMYASAEERVAGIERGALLSATALRDWLQRSADALDSAMETLTQQQWTRQVTTAQGRTVPASETPWMRAREVCVHVVDLDVDITFADLPGDFLASLVTEITAKRGDTPTVDGPLPEIAAWLAGRPYGLDGVPPLGPWL
jgi:maleylpyruvate isomerase